MRARDFEDAAPGALIQTINGAHAFVPDPLPEKLDLTAEIVLQLESATLAIGRLDQLGRSLVNPHLLVQPFVRREAVASSRMEGTTADLGQLLLFEATRQSPASDSDVREVANYVAAVDYGLRRPRERPVSLGLIREMHQILLDGVRGEQYNLGDFRDRQNWISGSDRSISSARFVPPPPDQVNGLMRDLERYWQTSDRSPALVRLALVHYQFETIHPFFDGNGRLGRLLMAVLLDDWQVLTRPLLYLSTAIERRRVEYHDELLRVSQSGNWSSWISFFLDAVLVSADDALQRGNRLIDLQDRYRIQYGSGGSTTPLKILDLLFETPAFTVSEMSRRVGIGFKAIQSSVDRLASDGVLVEVTGQRRHRVYVASEIVAAVSSPEPNSFPDTDGAEGRLHA